MSLLSLLKNNSKKFYYSLGLLGLISTLTNLSILAMINFALTQRSLTTGIGMIVGFGGLLLFSFVCSVFFQNKMSELTNQSVCEMELNIVRKIQSSSYETFQRLGPERIFTAINESWKLGRLPEVLVSFVNSAVMVLCGFVYLFWVSVLGGAGITLFMLSLFCINFYRNGKIEKRFKRKSRFQERYYASLHELINGFRQIKISSVRRANLFQYFIQKNRNAQKVQAIRCAKEENSMKLSGIYSWYVVLGFIVFAFPILFNLTAVQIASLITAIFFLLAPAASMLNAIPFYADAKVALDNLNEVDAALQEEDIPSAKPQASLSDFHSIRFEDVVYKYRKNDMQSFFLQVHYFEVTKEEILFITGGNGSGKTTFLNVFTGLLKPEHGRVYIDEKEITWEEFRLFNESMATIYSDHYLFRENYDKHNLSPSNDRLNALKDLLLVNGIFRVNANDHIDIRFSKGQQKRLSLLLALLEDKPILVLDEWAAEQDQFHKTQFYQQWLQAVKAMGKSVILITHDDDFYHTADRVIRFDYGQIVSDSRKLERIESQSRTAVSDRVDLTRKSYLK